MARAGIASRRKSEKIIEQGRVTVNGQVATLGDKADLEKDHIRVDGKLLQGREPLQYIALYKPQGVISAVTSPDPRPTVREMVPVEGRLWPVGRLDVDSEGLILLTNDGKLTHKLTHPSFEVDKEYRALVAGEPDREQLEIWQRGVVLPDGYRTAPARVKVDGQSKKGTWLRVTMHEGRKRQIREIGDTIGLPVIRLVRVRIGNLHLGRLKRRQWRHLTKQEVKDLKGLF